MGGQSAVDRPMHDRATTQLNHALGGGSEDLASAIAKAFVAAHKSTAANDRLRSLILALRNNEELRSAVLRQGPTYATALAQQDPRDWANKKIQAQRQTWTAEALKEACPFGAQIGTCPECGGR